MKTNFENRLIWLNGKIVPLQEATINVLSPTSQFGANIFEGIRCYWNKEQGQMYAFRLDDHYKRLQNSVKMMRFEERYTVIQMKEGLLEIVRANAYKEDIAVRQTIFLDGLGNWSSTRPTGMFISPIPKQRAYSDDIEGIHCCISSWERISDTSLSPRIKLGANYMNSRLAQLEALQNGYDSSIFLNKQGKISEAPGSCVFIVREGILITPPGTASVLESITRTTIIEIAQQELNLKVIEREIDRTELYISEEIFLCGTAMEIVPVLSVDRFIIEEGTTGTITRKLMNIYFEIVRGQNEKYKKWITPVYK